MDARTTDLCLSHHMTVQCFQVVKPFQGFS
jgi:hypothetical protein